MGEAYTRSSQRYQIDPVKKPKDIKTVILGIGNILLGDEGIGVHIIKRLSKEKLPPHVMLIDGSTAGFRLFPVFEEYKNSRFIIIDAVKPINPSAENSYRRNNKDTPSNGEILVIPLEDFYNPDILKHPDEHFISFHQTSLVDVLHLFYLTYKIKVMGYLIGIDISRSMDEGLPLSMELTDKIEEKIPKIIDLVKKYIDQ